MVIEKSDDKSQSTTSSNKRNAKATRKPPLDRTQKMEKSDEETPKKKAVNVE